MHKDKLPYTQSNHPPFTASVRDAVQQGRDGASCCNVCIFLHCCGRSLGAFGYVSRPGQGLNGAVLTPPSGLTAALQAVSGDANKRGSHIPDPKFLNNIQ
jgi:hypothetical protein